jgi:hypothetical protein
MVTEFAVLLLIGLIVVIGYLAVFALAFVLDWASQRR